MAAKRALLASGFASADVFEISAPTSADVVVATETGASPADAEAELLTLGGDGAAVVPIIARGFTENLV